MSLEQWIIQQRLDGARQALLSRFHRRTTIAAIARAWGFSSTSHFSRRFHNAYGMAPGAWRRLHTDPAGDRPG